MKHIAVIVILYFSIAYHNIVCAEPDKADAWLLGKGNINITAKDEKILSAPEQIEIENRLYTLESCAWRDFQPVCPPDGEPLIVIVRLVAADSSNVPSYISFRRIWVVYGEDMWIAGFSAETRYYGNRLERVVRGGPKWGPDVKVDIIAEVYDGEGKTYLIKAPRQVIGKTF